jgi:hypothetical protein
MASPSASSPSSVAERGLALLHIDFVGSSRGPSPTRLVVATALSIGLSLLADALLVVICTHLFPATKGYGHFRFSDYAKLTVIGIVIAAAAWPVVVRVCTAPRWLFVRLAVVVTLVLLLPDVYILHQGQPVRAVLFLMLMHLAIGVITYNALVRVAPPRPRSTVPG